MITIYNIDDKKYIDIQYYLVYNVYILKIWRYCMKFTKILAAVLAVTTLTSACIITNAQEVPGIVAPDDANYAVMPIDDVEEAVESKEIYVSVEGKDENDGLTPETAVPSINKALEILGLNGGTIIIVGEVSLGDKAVAWPGKKADGMKRVTITGYDDDAVLAWNRSLNPNGDLTLEYLNIRIDKEWAYLNARGNHLILGRGLVMTLKEGLKTYFPVRGGGDTNQGVDGDTHVTVYSGTYSSIMGGSRNATIKGSTLIEFYGGRVTSSITGGCEIGTDATENGNVEGDTVIKIYGGNVNNASGGGGKRDNAECVVMGKKILDVSQYSDAQEKWYANFDEVKEYDPNLVPAKPQKPEVKADGAFIKGYEDSTFRPQNQITRAEAITVISRLFASDDELKGKYQNRFTDVKAEDWFVNNIAYLDSFGALEALEERGTTIAPNQPITRGEVCELIYAVGNFDAMKIVDFKDLTPITGKSAIYALASEGIITGYKEADGTYTFKPKGTITRAEFVTIIDRFLGRTANADNAKAVNKFTDAQDHWALNYIVAASSEKTVDGKDIWTQEKKDIKFELSENAKTSEDYIKELKAASADLSAKAITDGIQAITDIRKEEIRNTKPEVEVTGTKYYVAADGDDANDGLSPEKPWKTMNKVTNAALKAGDGVFFKRGDIFTGQIMAKSGVTYSAYGEGAKPKLYAAEENAAVPSLWVKTDVENIWMYNKDCSLDIGNIVFDGETNARKIYRSQESDGKKLDYYTKREFNTWKDIKDDLSFFHAEDNRVYLRCEKGNPGELYNEIRLVPKVSIIRVTTNNNVTIDNLHFEYGNFGVSLGSSKGNTVQNCEFKWIGGCIMKGPLEYSAQRTFPTPYGNAVETYGQAQDFTIDNCLFDQIYDAAMTHQGSSSGNIEVKNVRYTNNVVERAVYAVEIFYGESKSASDKRSFSDTYVENNILRMGGGFGHFSRPDGGVTALIRNGGIMNNTTNYIVRNNILDRSLTKIVQAANDGGSKAQYFDNIYVQKKDEMFCARLGKTYIADENIGFNLTATSTETNPTYILVSEFGF